VGVNALWPRTVIDTSAVRNLLGGEAVASQGRSADIMSDAAHVILTRAHAECTGNFFIDENVLREAGVTDLEKYAVTPGADLVDDFFLP
jgi:citronellol/citronellal dehydrogenase